MTKWDAKNRNTAKREAAKTPAAKKLGPLDASAHLPPGKIVSVRLINRKA